MKNTFAAIKFWMDKILSIACAVLLTFMTVLVLIQVLDRKSTRLNSSHTS